MALVVLAGEGHGFRKAATRKQALAAELSFLAQLFAITPADDLPRLPIENLPGSASGLLPATRSPAHH